MPAATSTPIPVSPPGRLAALLDLALPRSCAGCERPGWSICPACRSRFGRPRSHAPAPCPPDWPPTFVSARYAGVVRSAVLAYKEHGRGELAGPLAVALADAVGVATRPGKPSLVVPVPSRRAVARARGGDHLLRLARPAVRRLRAQGYAVHLARLLRLTGRPVDSAGLSAPARAANVRGAFGLAPGAQRLLSDVRIVVLVDDVVTTGATLAEATRTLRTAAPVTTYVRAAAVAATPRHRATAAPDRRRPVTDSDRR